MKTKILWILVVLALISFSCNDGEDVYEYTGIVEGVSVKVPALTGGKIINMNIKEGQFIEKGQLIAVVDTLELTINKDQVSASLEEIAVQTEIAKNNLSRIDNDYKYVKDKYDRMNKLYISNSIPKQSLDDVKNKYESVESALVSAKQNLNSVGAKRKQLEAQLKLIQKKINDAKIISPFAGYITSKFFEAGEAIMPLSPVVEIINTKKMETDIYVSETQLPEINLGQEVTINIDGTEKNLTGKIDWISPESEFTPKTILTPETRTSLVYAVKVAIDNPDGLLKHGMPVVVELSKGLLSDKNEK
jgi:membrane fusion protein YbhG